MKRLKLFEQQKEAVEFIKEFQKSDNVTILSGIAGTGKTTIIREVFMRKKAKSKEFYIPKSVIGITVTHQARLNLMKSIPNSTTYASAVNLVMEFDAHGEMYFVPKYGKSYFSELLAYDHIVVDECSQFSQEMIDLLLSSVNNKAKIYFLGDYHQLPPIQDKKQTDPYIDSPTFNYLNYKLTQKVRQKDGEYIADLCDTICKQIDDTTIVTGKQIGRAHV